MERNEDPLFFNERVFEGDIYPSSFSRYGSIMSALNTSLCPLGLRLQECNEVTKDSPKTVVAYVL